MIQWKLFILSAAILVGCKTRKFEGQVKSNENNNLQSFFQREEWPHYSDFIEAFGENLVLQKKVYLDNTKRPPQFVYSESKVKNFAGDFKDIYQLVTGLEYSFPNAEYACIGRDAMLACDMLDVFYQVYTGEKRMNYIGISGTTFENIRNSLDMQVEVSKKLLLSNGFKPENFVKKTDTPRPYVIIDATAWYAENNNDSKMSQARIVLKAAYALAREAGAKNEDLLSQLGAVATSGGSGRVSQNYFFLRPQFDLGKYFSFLQQDLQKGFDHPTDVMRMNLGASSYGVLFWHDKFGEVYTDEYGKTKAKISYPIYDARDELYNRMLELNEFILSPAFQQEMKQEAQRWNLPILEKILKKEFKNVSKIDSTPVSQSEKMVVKASNETPKPVWSTSRKISVSNKSVPTGTFQKDNMLLHVNESDEDGFIIAFETIDKKGVLVSEQLAQKSTEFANSFVISLQGIEKCNVLDIKESSTSQWYVAFSRQNLPSQCQNAQSNLQEYLGLFKLRTY